LPQANETWLAFAAEERLHANWINRLSTYYQDGRIESEQPKFTSQATKTAIAYIENQTGKTLREKPVLRQCLNIAIDIEKSLLESAFFKVFKLTVPETRKIKSQLEGATRSHLERLMRWREEVVNA
jgi:hypothetical protein